MDVGDSLAAEMVLVAAHRGIFNVREVEFLSLDSQSYAPLSGSLTPGPPDLNRLSSDTAV